MYIEIDSKMRMYKRETLDESDLEEVGLNGYLFINLDDLTEYNGREWVEINEY